MIRDVSLHVSQCPITLLVIPLQRRSHLPVEMVGLFQ